MAAGDITVYSKYRKALLDGDAGGLLSNTPADLDSDTLKVMLLTTAFTPDTTGSSAQEHIDDVSSDQVSTGGTEYTGPVTLAGATVVESSGVVTFDATDITVGIDASGFTDAGYLVLYVDSGTPATSPLIAVGDLGGAQVNTTAALILEWAASGILTLTQV